MDATVWTSIIGGGATLISAFLSPIVASKIRAKKRSRFMPRAPVSRQESLFGSWAGEMDQKIGIPSVTNNHKLYIEFAHGNKPIEGMLKIGFVITGDSILDCDSYIEAKVINTIYDGRILKCDYVNKDNNAIHFGTLYGELSSTGKEIKGEFLGYGIISERFVSGSIHLRKQNGLAAS